MTMKYRLLLIDAVSSVLHGCSFPTRAVGDSYEGEEPGTRNVEPGTSTSLVTPTIPAAPTSISTASPVTPSTTNSNANSRQ